MENRTFLWSLLEQHTSPQSVFEEGRIACKMSVYGFFLFFLYDNIYHKGVHGGSLVLVQIVSNTITNCAY